MSKFVRWHISLSPEEYRPLWIPAALIPTALALLNIYLLLSQVSTVPTPPGLPLKFFSMVVYLAARVGQLVLCMMGSYFTQNLYWVWHNLLLGLAFLIAIIYTFFPWLSQLEQKSIIIFVCWNVVITVVERWIVGDGLRQLKIDQAILACLEFIISSDWASDAPTAPSIWVRMSERFKLLFHLRSTGPIALLADDEPVLELGRQHLDHSSWDPPADLSKHLTHWCQLSVEWDTHKALWITADSHEMRNGVIHASSKLLSSAGGESNVVLVDVSQTRTIFWPLVRSLASASPEYMGQLAQDPPPILTFQYQYYYLGLFNVPPVSTWSYYDDSQELVRALFIRPVNRIYKALAEGVKKNKKDTDDVDLERGQPAPQMPRTTLIVHGVRDTEQADELWILVDQLKDKLKTRFKSLGIVIVSEPALLRHNSEDDRLILDYFCTMHVSEKFVLYSGVSPTPPVLCENLFQLFADGVHRIGGSKAERLWPKVLKLSPDDDSNPGELENSTTAILAKLHKAAEGRKQLLECLPDIYFIKRSHILKQQAQDNIKIAHRLEQLFELNYRKEIAGVPREHAISVLNLTHSILDGVLPKNDVIKDAQQFSRRAHRLLNLLAAQLKLLPEELAVKEVVLLSEHPIKHGGFSNIYHGRYKNPDGEHQEVALKVLKIFEDQSDDRRNLLHDKFTKEALVWHYLRHKNIVKFIGVDSTTFPSPARAMVSPWMAQGSVLKYIAETSPVAPYAVELLDDVIKGLKYLHSVNIVHGDLCGRNILIDARGRACLTDFGLAAFVESDVTIKSSTRSGSVRWMAPELLSPPPGVSFRRTTASDLWAFGCVCGEIWTEGTAPFSHLSHEMGIIFAFSDPTNSPPEQPYQTRPSDKRGTLMPDRLWELAQWCWKYDASERPAVQVVADMLAEMRRQKNPNALLLEEEDDDAPPVASSSGTRHVGSETSSSAHSVEYEAPPLSSHVSSADAVDDNLSSIVASAKGKQRVVHFEDESPAVVRFGPLLLTPDADYEDAFFKIFEMLCELVSRRALVEPRSIHPYGGEYIDLHFRNELEANSFAMTWTVHRFEPYLECNAALIDAD